MTALGGFSKTGAGSDLPTKTALSEWVECTFIPSCFLMRSTAIQVQKTEISPSLYAALDLHQRTVQAVVKEEDGTLVKEAEMRRDGKEILEFLDVTNAEVVMESGLNHQYIRDLLKENNYDVMVAHPLTVKAIAYARVKSDRVDARTLADLLRTKMIPEAYIPDKEIRDLRDLVRRKHRKKTHSISSSLDRCIRSPSRISQSEEIEEHFQEERRGRIPHFLVLCHVRT